MHVDLDALVEHRRLQGSNIIDCVPTHCLTIDPCLLDPGDYGTHSIRRTKAMLIYRRTKYLRAVQRVLGHTKLESTVRYLGIKVDDALEMSEQTEVGRSVVNSGRLPATAQCRVSSAPSQPVGSPSEVDFSADISVKTLSAVQTCPMKRNHRNYYRILHVQPEAPPEVITASYRLLMGPLRHHPDLGGEHETAALLNEAYAVLSDPDRRRAYDRTLGKERLRGRAVGHDGPGAPPANAHASSFAQAPDPTCWRIDRCCPFCRHPLPATLRTDARCTRCDGPLNPPPQPEAKGRELFGRRASSRRVKNHSVVLVPNFKATSLSAVMRDLSLTGVRLIAPVPIAVNQAIRIIDLDFDAVAVVVSCRRSADLYSIHARFLTLRLIRQAGVFVSVKA